MISKNQRDMEQNLMKIMLMKESINSFKLELNIGKLIIKKLMIDQTQNASKTLQTINVIILNPLAK